MRIQQILLFGIAVASIVALVVTGIPPSDSDEIGGSADAEDSKVEVFLGPDVNDIRMGYVAVVEKSYDAVANTIEYRAIAKDGYRFVCWQDEDGEVMGTANVMAFQADKDRAGTAVFAEAGIVCNEYVWYPPVFNADGTVSHPSKAILSVAISESDYRASIRDATVQRAATVSVPSPVRLCAADGAVEQVAAQLSELTEGMTNLKKALTVLAFVQDAIDYETDMQQYGSEEFWTKPMETLYSMHGDCEDTATLFVSIASVMGIDCGFVMFEHDKAGTAGSGHMSVAVALKDGEKVSGTSVATFVGTDGVTYAYGETAVDPDTIIGGYHPTLGALSAAYSISDGRWTKITYADGEFSAAPTVAIGNGSAVAVGEAVYGADWSNPPAVTMSVRDTFSYRPLTNLSSEITASGNGLSFLTFDKEAGTLYGKAVKAGTYTVVLDAVSTVGPEQHAVQTVTLIVTDSAESVSTDYELRYGASGWTVQSSADGGAVAESESSDSAAFKVVLAGIIAVLVAALAARRLL